jgi:hypothetical protein
MSRLIVDEVLSKKDKEAIITLLKLGRTIDQINTVTGLSPYVIKTYADTQRIPIERTKKIMEYSKAAWTEYRLRNNIQSKTPYYEKTRRAFVAGFMSNHI